MHSMKHGGVRGIKITCLSHKMRLEGSAIAATYPGLSKYCLRRWEETCLGRVALSEGQFIPI